MTHVHALPEFLKSVWLIAAGIGVWMLVNAILPYVSGWNKLSRLYPANGKCHGTVHPMQNLTIGRSTYRRIIRCVTTAEGLHLSSYRMFNIGSSPIFIPWDNMHIKSERKCLFWRDGVEVEIDSFLSPVVVPKKAIQQTVFVDDKRPEPFNYRVG